MRVWRFSRWRGIGPSRRPLHIREISQEYGIPERYLVQILLQLKGAGLVASTRGAGGGYRLARPASSISLSEILVAMDGPDDARRGPSATERAGRFSSDARLGKRPSRGTPRARPDHDRSARRTIIPPRVDHLSPEERQGQLRFPIYRLRGAPAIPSTSTTPAGGEFRDSLRVRAV